jgi:hypothetical protein
VGSDSGRDIWAVEEGQRNICVQCANTRLTFKKAAEDTDKIVDGPNGVPDLLRFVAGTPVSAKLRDKIKAYVTSKGIKELDLWSGAEFEERVRADAEGLLQRFENGKEFPDAPEEIQAFVDSLNVPPDDQILSMIAELFDRPAFYTPFHSESSIPDFKQAITDTIQALSTGIQQTRDGKEIRRIPNRRQLRSDSARLGLASVERMLCELRAEYDKYLRTGDLRLCGCNDPKCPVFMISPRAASGMDRLRSGILDEFRRIFPRFSIRLGSDFRL